VKQKYNSFVSQKVPTESSSDSDEDCIDLITTYEPKLPFLIAENEEQRKVFQELASVQKALQLFEQTLALNERRVDGLNAEYDVLRSQDNPNNIERMDECLKSKIYIFFQKF